MINNYFIKIFKIRDSMEVTKNERKKDPYERVQEVSAKRSLEPFPNQYLGNTLLHTSHN